MTRNDMETCSRPSLRPEGLLRALALMAVLIVPWPAPAQETPPDEPAAEATEPAAETPDEDLPVVHDHVFVDDRMPAIPTSNTVAAKLPLPLRETPASVAVVETGLIEEQYAVTVGEALRNVSGLNLQPGSGVFDFFVVRGLDSIAGGLILTDGAPEPKTTSFHLYNAERVEVFKGPSAFVYGGSPLAATVNLVRKQPIWGNFVRFGITTGSFATWEATVDANTSNASANASFRFNSLYQQSDNYRDGTASETWAVNPAFTWRPNDRTSVNFNAEYVDLDYVTDQGLPLLFTNEIPDVPRTRSYHSPFDHSDQEVRRFQIDLETRLTPRVALRNKTFYRSLDWYVLTTNFAGVFPDQTGALQVFRTNLELDDLQEFVGNQFEILWRLGLGTVTHTLMAGLELGRREDEFTFGYGLLPAIDLYHPVETAEQLSIFPLSAADTRTLVTAPYLLDQISIGDKLQLLLAARYDNIDFEDAVVATERDNDQVSPMVGVVVLPTPTLSLYANYGEAFNPQSPFVVGEERVPEESRQYELGVKKDYLGGRVRTTLALYEIERHNIAIPDATGVLQQTGDQRSRGLEIELSAEWRPGLRTFVAYAYTDAELTEFRETVSSPLTGETFVVDHSGNTPPFTPQHLLNFWVSKQLPGGWGFGAGGRWVSQQFIDEDNAFELDDYFLLDAAVFYTRGPWRLHLNLKNLTDEEYFTRAARGNSLIPRPGTAAYGGFQYRF